MIIERTLFHSIGGFRKGLEGAQDWDLALRARDFLDATGQKIFHIEKILYHWREVPGSTATNADNKPYAFEAGLRSVRDYLERKELPAIAIKNDLVPGTVRVKYEVPSLMPSVEIIIPTRDELSILRKCVDSIIELTEYPNFNITVIDNGSIKTETLEYLDRLRGDTRFKIVKDDSPFNYSKLNNDAVESASADFICLLNNDVEVVSADWLTELISLGSLEGVGAVGPMLLYPNQMIQHAGVVLGMGGLSGVAGHWHKGLNHGDYGYMGRLGVLQNYSAVTGACLLIKRSNFKKIGGFDTQLKVAFNDVDLCLKLLELGLRNVWTPFVFLIHHESISRGYDDTPEKLARATQEVLLMKSRWGAKLYSDTCFNSNLSLRSEKVGFSYQNSR